MKKNTKNFKAKGFSILEILVVTVILSIGILSIISIVLSISSKVQMANQRVIATNMTKEGVEAVYQIRDNNILINDLDKREKNWLKVDPYSSNSQFMLSGYYTIQESQNTNKNNYYKLVKVDNKFDNTKDSDLSTKNMDYALCLDESTGYWNNCVSGGDPSTKYGEFYREIAVKGIFDQDGIKMSCDTQDDYDNNNNNCTSKDDPKELRFCVTTYYYFPGKSVNNVEICSVMTNFFKSE